LAQGLVQDAPGSLFLASFPEELPRPATRPELTECVREAMSPPCCFTGFLGLFQPRPIKNLDAWAWPTRISLAEAWEDEKPIQEVLALAERDGVEVARYSRLPQFDASILDTYIPRCKRLTQLFFGVIVSNPHAPMAFREKMGYNMTYNLVPPGNGNALHMHQSIEIFIALDGRWEIAWGMQGEHTVVLEPWDMVMVPARLCHSYKNIEEQTAQNIMTILPGRSWIAWAPNVVKEARSYGAECDDNGMLQKYAHLVASTNTKDLASAADAVQWMDMGPDDMAGNVFRFKEGRPLTCQMQSEEKDGETPFIEMFWKTLQCEACTRLPRKAGVDLLLVVLEGSLLVQNEQGRAVAAAGKLDAIRVPAQVLAAGEVIINNPCPYECTLLVTATQMRDLNETYFHLC